MFTMALVLSMSKHERFSHSSSPFDWLRMSGIKGFKYLNSYLVQLIKYCSPYAVTNKMSGAEEFAGS